MSAPDGPRLLAVSDLHVRHAENREIADALVLGHPGDWLIVAGDVDERIDSVITTLAALRSRFAVVLWVPGNHELWTRAKNARAEDPDSREQLAGVARYDELVRRCREIDVRTPEDDYPVWEGAGGPVVVAPLFVPYDYSFLPAGTSTPEEGLAAAHAAGVVCTDEYLLHPDPYPSRPAWSADRVATTRARLDAIDPALPTVLVNHWPLVRTPCDVLWYPEFALWCGTTATADWHLRYRARAVVHGHLHIPRTVVVNEVPFVEVSLGYPREWRRHSERLGSHFPDELPRTVLGS
ncbi:metallophosphoesterase family protein [Pseudonocardia sp. HH130630-07]|uniref:metallophosphoesterase family protein n=1 Tax=Pseudonocardia sp. HH130630-07 TaxID=1690815 RepID=UPI00081507C4|nr:metallophosphoesterase [Pseudonocardia sp. HH130630-07]ANY05169.1 metallophosphoesterase [Pseudonocardia sp. HH130630-07]